jgi:hypothetical protein
MLRLYVRRSGRTLEAFGDPVATCSIANRTLEEAQSEAARALNIRVEFIDAAAPPPGPSPYFVAEDDTFFTVRYFTEFATRARALEKNCRAGLASNTLLDRGIAAHPRAAKTDGGWLFDLWYVVAPESSAFEPICLEMDDLEHSTARIPSSLKKEQSVTFFESSLAILHLESPLHLYQANMHKNFERLRDLAIASRSAWHASKGRALDSHGNLIGEGVAIHPTAWVEGSVIEAGAIIGPQVACRYSMVGEGAVVAEQSTLYRSILGKNAQVHMQCRLVQAVMLEESFLSQGPIQYTLVGKSSALFAVIPTDFRFDGQNVQTVVGGRVVDSGMCFLGLLVGHGSKVTNVVTAPGRIVPNGVEIHPDPSTVYRGWPKDRPAEGTLFVGAERN